MPVSIATFLEKGEWKCVACGACCKFVDRDLPQGLQHFDLGDGTCRYLDHNNQCTIYNDRPFACRVGRRPNDHLFLAGNCLKVYLEAENKYPPVIDIREVKCQNPEATTEK
jgi:hypothetical protein